MNNIIEYTGKKVTIELDVENTAMRLDNFIIQSKKKISKCNLRIWQDRSLYYMYDKNIYNFGTIIPSIPKYDKRYFSDRIFFIIKTDVELPEDNFTITYSYKPLIKHLTDISLWYDNYLQRYSNNNI